MPAEKDDGTVLKKKVNPKGQILNDNDTGVDHLGHTPYAKALAKIIRDVKTPVTIGVFARWGSGKSFLLKYVCNILKRRQTQYCSLSRRKDPKRADTFCKILPFISVLSATIVLATLAVIVPIQHRTLKTPLNVTITNSTAAGATVVHKRLNPHCLAIAAFAWSLLVIVVAMMGWCCCRRGFSSVGSTLKLLCIAAFTKLPVDNLDRAIVPGDDCEADMKLQDEDRDGNDAEDGKAEREASKGKRRYIFVHFNAWAYARSDNLWAGIVTNLADAIEAEFGCMTSRLFRLLDVETVSRDSVTGPARFYAKFEEDPRQGQLKKILSDFGVVHDIARYKDKKRKTTVQYKYDKVVYEEAHPLSSDDWWVVEYSCRAEAQKALNYLVKEEVEVSLTEQPSGKSATDDLSLSSDKSWTADRCLSSDKDAKDHRSPDDHGFCSLFRRRPKTALKVPVLFLAILIAFALSAIVVSVFAWVNSGMNTTSGDLAKSFAFLPLATTTLYAICQFVWAMFHSQTSRITTALQGTNASMAQELGVMDKIKYEVDVITKLIQCVRFSHHKDYKVVITIDDLDRIALNKLKSVLEAVSILLSDPSSPFVCMIAVDSRIAVKCIEDGMSSLLLEDNVNGHEYLKKIINLPFCLPECDQKQKFIDGLVDQSDETKNRREKITPQNGTETTTDGNAANSNRPVLNSVDLNDADPTTCPDSDDSDAFDEVDSGPIDYHGDSTPPYTPVTEIDQEPFKESKLKEQTPKEFMFACSVRPYRFKTCYCTCQTRDSGSIDYSLTQVPSPEIDFSQINRLRRVPSAESGSDFAAMSYNYNNRAFLKEPKIRSYLHGNPRSIKRIFNVLSLTTVIIKCKEKEELKKAYFSNKRLQKSTAIPKNDVGENNGSKPQITKSRRCQEFAEELVRWVILTDQWPYRMSYILQVIEDADQRSSAGRNGEEIGNQETLFDIYCEKVPREMRCIENNRLLALDGDPDIFYSFLKDLKASMKKETATRLRRYSINLDQSLRQTIAHQRSVRDLKGIEQTEQDEKNVPNPRNEIPDKSDVAIQGRKINGEPQNITRRFSADKKPGPRKAGDLLCPDRRSSVSACV